MSLCQRKDPERDFVDFFFYIVLAVILQFLQLKYQDTLRKELIESFKKNPLNPSSLKQLAIHANNMLSVIKNVHFLKYWFNTECYEQ